MNTREPSENGTDRPDSAYPERSGISEAGGGVEIMGKHRLKWQMIAAIIGVSFAAVTLTVLTVYNTSRRIIQQQYVKMAEDNLCAMNIMLEKNMSGLVDSLRGYILDDEQLEIISGEPAFPNNKYYDSYSSAALTANVQPIFTQEAEIDGLYLFDHYNRYFMYKKTGIGHSVYQKYYNEDVDRESTWYQMVEETRGKEIFLNGDVLNPDNEECFSIVKKVNDSRQSYQPVGVVILTVKKNFLRQYYRDMNLKNVIFFIDADENYVFSLGSEESAAEYYRAYLAGKSGREGEYLFLEQYNNATGWKIVTGVRRDELYEEDAYIRNYISTLLFIVVLAVVLMSALISNSIYKPLRNLESVVEEINQGSLQIKTQFDNSEIGIIGQTLKKTLDENVYLEKKIVQTELSQRKAQLLLLQGQINPHYLYNTLDSIYVLALKHQAEDIGQMVLVLSDLFKLSLKGGKGYGTVREELAYVEKYMRIMSYRFQNRIRVCFDVEEEIEDACMISFILQPFVENAVLHGLEPKVEGGCVYVTGERLQDRLIFRIYDDGVGFDANDSSIQEGYGIQNVRERIRLIYGEAFGVEVHSEIGRGTTVTICIPYRDREFYESSVT